MIAGRNRNIFYLKKIIHVWNQADWLRIPIIIPPLSKSFRCLILYPVNQPMLVSRNQIALIKTRMLVILFVAVLQWNNHRSGHRQWRPFAPEVCICFSAISIGLEFHQISNNWKSPLKNAAKDGIFLLLDSSEEDIFRKTGRNNVHYSVHLNVHK